MSKRTISIDNFASGISRELTAYGEQIIKGNQKNVSRVARDTVKQLKRTSPRKSGDYAEGWTSNVETDRLGGAKAILYNKEKGSITHLLENGHEIVPQGGTVDPKPHIEDAARKAEEEFLKLTEEMI